MQPFCLAAPDERLPCAMQIVSLTFSFPPQQSQYRQVGKSSFQNPHVGSVSPVGLRDISGKNWFLYQENTGLNRTKQVTMQQDFSEPLHC